MNEIYNRLLYRITKLCRQREYSSYQVRQKALQSRLSPSQAQQMADELISAGFIDDNRYCKAFVHDKLQFHHWGKRKIRQMLMLQEFDADVITQNLDQIDEEDYLRILHAVFASKRRLINDSDPYEVQQKLIKYAAGKGFELDLVLREIKQFDINQSTK